MRSQRFRLTLVVLVLVSALAVTGCWDRTEVNDIAIVVATSFDLEPDGQFRVSCQMALPGQMGGSNGGGGGTSGTKSFFVDSEVGRTIREANARQQARLSRHLFFAHRRVLVIGEELAKRGIREVYDVIARVPENRLTSNIVISAGKGYDLLNAQPQFERFSAEAMREILISDAMVQVNLKDVAQELSQTGVDPLLPYMKTLSTTKTKEKSKEVGFVGYAQFHDDKMVGVITKEASEGVHWLQKKFRPYMTTLDEMKEFGKVSIYAYRGKSKITPVPLADHLRFDIDIQAICYVVESLSDVDFGLTENVEKLQKVLNEHIRRSVEDTIAQIKKVQSDSGGLGLHVARSYPRLWREKYMYDWYAELEKAQFNITVQSEISRIGLISENIAKRVKYE